MSYTMRKEKAMKKYYVWNDVNHQVFGPFTIVVAMNKCHLMNEKSKTNNYYVKSGPSNPN